VNTRASLMRAKVMGMDYRLLLMASREMDRRAVPHADIAATIRLKNIAFNR